MKKMLAAATALVLTIANAANPPEMKEGLWLVHTQSIGNPGNRKSDGTYMLCRNHAYDQSVQARAKSKKGCTMISESFQDGKYSVDMHCVVLDTVVESKGTTTYQGDTSTHSETHAIYTPETGRISEMTTIIDQKYVGNCPAGAQPGDRTDADGRVTQSGKH